MATEFVCLFVCLFGMHLQVAVHVRILICSLSKVTFTSNENNYMIIILLFCYSELRNIKFNYL